MPAARYPIDGDKLRALREGRDLSIRELSRLTKVDQQTISESESGHRRKVMSRTLRKLAAGLAVHWEDLLVRETARKLGLKRIADELAPRSTLDVQWYAEREGAEPRLQTDTGNTEVFGVGEFVDTMTAPRVREGDRYYVHGEVANQRALTELDEVIVDAPQLEGGYFEIVRKLDADLEPFTLTVVTRNLEHTGALQRLWRTGELAKIVVRVLVTVRIKDERSLVEVTNMEGGTRIARPCVLDGVRWSGFRLISAREGREDPPAEFADRPHPWCLLVENILSMNS